MFIIGRGKLVFLREENNEEYIEDHHGVMVAKSNKASFKGWIGKMFPENSSENSPHFSPSSSTSNSLLWEKNVEETENYFHQLLTSNAEEEDGEMENEIFQSGPTETDKTQNMVRLLFVFTRVRK